MNEQEQRLTLRRRLGYLLTQVLHWREGVMFDLSLWKRENTPHVVKRRIILDHARQYGLRRFVETGTYAGDMLAMMSRHFDELHSVELSTELHERARLRFASQPQIRLHQGDSGQVVRRVLEQLDGPALFWLDAHWSGGMTARGTDDSPIVPELRHILADPRPHVILVDDARYFTGAGGYPTMDGLRELVHGIRPEYEVVVELDIIRITPRKGAA
jgi:hypothetical protein